MVLMCPTSWPWQLMQVYVCYVLNLALAADMISHLTDEAQLTLPSSDATRLCATVLKVPKMLLV